MSARLRRLVLFAIPLLCLPAVAAHWDGIIERETVDVPAGGEVRLPFEAHFHRIVGSYAVDAPGARAVSVAYARDGSANETELAVGSEGRLHALIACCDDDAWAAHDLIIRNPNDTPVRVTVAAKLLHDDLAVIAYDAEEGAAIQTMLLMMLIASPFAWRAHTRIDRTLDPQAARQSLRKAQIVWGTMLGIAALLALVGMFRYAAGPAAGFVASGALLPSVPYVAASSLLASLLIILWFVALHHYTRAIGRWPGALQPLTLWGFVLIIGVAMVFLAIGLEHGRLAWPFVITLGVSAPVVFILLRVRRLTDRTPDADGVSATETV